jgi:hypothetical protein
MSLLCGWASQSENKSKNGKKGDQTGWEVKTGSYYNFGQDKLIRFRNPARRKKAAKALKKMCNNNNIGYGQDDRSTLYSQCQKIGWDVKRIGEIGLCNGDCSELCGCAINFAYGKEVVPSAITTATFESYTVSKYPKRFKKVTNLNPSLFKLGDMPLKAGKHIIMVIGL